MTPDRDYRTKEYSTPIIFDLRVPGNPERLHRERAAWREYADIEMLDFDHAVLIIRLGAARRDRAHRGRNAERLDGVSAEVTVYYWDESPESR